MDALKKFIGKKRAEAKFKNAGPGQRLTDNAPSAGSPSSAKGQGNRKNDQKRSSPAQQPQKPKTDSLEERRQAAMAALARQEKVKPKTSTNEDLIAHRQLAFIKEQARKEIEAEKRLKELELSEGQNPKSSSPGNNEQEHFTTDAAIGGTVDPAYYAVTGVYYSCPIIGPDVLPRNEILELIQEFLFAQPREELGVTSCLLIHSCNKSHEKIRICVETLSKYIDNIIQNPEDPKYRKIRCSNKVFQEKVANVVGALEFLEACGFNKIHMKTNGSDSQDEDFWVFAPEGDQQSFVPKLTELSDLLKTTSPIEPDLDRNLQVLMPAQVSERRELPPEFYQLTGEELKREQLRRTMLIEKELTLRTKAQRENDERREQRLYRYAVMRIRFPDGFTLQGTFGSTEKIGDLYAFVHENLAMDDVEFVLKQAGGEALNNLEATLAEHRLPPASVVNFKLESAGSSSSGEISFLKPEILALVQNM